MKSLTCLRFYHFRNIAKHKAVIAQPKLQIIILSPFHLHQQVISGPAVDSPEHYCKAVDPV